MLDPKKKKLVIILSVLFVAISVVLIVVAIIFRINEGPDTNTNPKVTSYTDPYSGETITYTENQVSENPNAVVYFGFSKLLEYGMTNNQVSFLKSYILLYSNERVKSNQSKIKEVTIDFSTYRQIMSEEVSSKTVEFTIILNRDEKLRYKFANTSVRLNDLSTLVYASNGSLVFDSKTYTEVEDH